MSVLHSEQGGLERKRLKEILISELERLMRDLKAGGMHWTSLFSCINRRVSKLEWMIIESAYKEVPLENLHVTLLILENNYIKMLQNITHVLLETSQKDTDTDNK